MSESFNLGYNLYEENYMDGGKHDNKKDCNLCKELQNGQCVLILTKHDNFIIGTVDGISCNRQALRLRNSLALPSCVICEIAGALLDLIPSTAQVNNVIPPSPVLTICDLLGGLLPFDSLICCEDIETITFLNLPLSGLTGLSGLANLFKKK